MGYSGAWSKHTEPVTQDVTVEAVYTINKYTVKFVANGVTVKNMTVNHGYVLKTSDYPAVPVVSGKTGEWIRYTRPITRNITITARYSDAGINPPVKPPIETSSINGATTSGNSTVKEIVTAHHSYIYTGGHLAQETVTTTIAPVDGTVASATDTISATTSGTISATASDSVAAIASNSTTTTETLYYAYDANGVPMSLTYTDTDGASATYYYATNIQGDVTAILDTTGTPVVEYTYDAWGNLLTTTGSLADTLGKANSLRYRGYVYDTETGFYYVSSRYYNPEIGRFINADITGTLMAGFESFAQYNLFTYCFNNPVNLSDTYGTWPSWATKIAIGVGAVLIGATAVALTAATGGAAAAFIGAAAAGLKAAAISGVIGAAVGAGTSAVSHRVSTGSWSGAGKAAAGGAVDGFASGFMTGGIMAGSSQMLSSGFKAAAKTGIPTGRNGGLTIGNKVRILSPNHPQAYEAGGTLLKIGSKYTNIRFDVGVRSLFHMNLQLTKYINYHIPLGILGSGLLGGIMDD